MLSHVANPLHYFESLASSSSAVLFCLILTPNCCSDDAYANVWCLHVCFCSGMHNSRITQGAEFAYKAWQTFKSAGKQCRLGFSQYYRNTVLDDSGLGVKVPMLDAVAPAVIS